MDSNKVSLNLKDKPEVQAALAGASAGDTVTMTIEFILDELTEDVAVGSIKECSDYKVTPGPDNDEDDEASEEEAEPVLSVMSPGYKKKY